MNLKDKLDERLNKLIKKFSNTTFKNYYKGLIHENKNCQIDIRERIQDFNDFFETIIKENSLFGLNDNDKKIIINIMDKYNIEPVNRNITEYKHIFYVHKQIIGDWR